MSEYWFSLNTPKALANFSPAVGAQRQPWEAIKKLLLNPERVRRLANAFGVIAIKFSN
jgi:hypothetical protein